MDRDEEYDLIVKSNEVATQIDNEIGSSLPLSLHAFLDTWRISFYLYGD